MAMNDSSVIKNCRYLREVVKHPSLRHAKYTLQRQAEQGLICEPCLQITNSPAPPQMTSRCKPSCFCKHVLFATRPGHLQSVLCLGPESLTQTLQQGSSCPSGTSLSPAQ